MRKLLLRKGQILLWIKKFLKWSTEKIDISKNQQNINEEKEAKKESQEKNKIKKKE